MQCNLFDCLTEKSFKNTSIKWTAFVVKNMLIKKVLLKYCHFKNDTFLLEWGMSFRYWRLFFYYGCFPYQLACWLYVRYSFLVMHNGLFAIVPFTPFNWRSLSVSVTVVHKRPFLAIKIKELSLKHDTGLWISNCFKSYNFQLFSWEILEQFLFF